MTNHASSGRSGGGRRLGASAGALLALGVAATAANVPTAATAATTADAAHATSAPGPPSDAPGRQGDGSAKPASRGERETAPTSAKSTRASPIEAPRTAPSPQPGPDAAGREDAAPWRLSLYWENDGTFIKPIDAKDQFYSNGFKLAFAGQPALADRFMRGLIGIGGFDAANLRTAGGFTLGQEIYTASDIEDPDPSPDDHPYAGWLYAGAFAQRSDNTQYDLIELNVGVLGSNAQADDIQQAIHRWRGIAQPRGWDTQLGNEIGFNVLFQHKWKLRLTDSDGDLRHDATAPFEAELIPQAGFVLGTINREVNVGGLLRVGRVPNDFGPGRLRDIDDATDLNDAARERWSAYGFVRLNGRVVEHDTFLQGNNFKGSRGVDPEPLVGELTLGLAFEWRQLELNWSFTFLTDEFKTQGDAHSFGTIAASWTMRF